MTRLGYWLRPFDQHLDRRRWRWQTPGCVQSRRFLLEQIGSEDLKLLVLYGPCGVCGSAQNTRRFELGDPPITQLVLACTNPGCSRSHPLG